MIGADRASFAQMQDQAREAVMRSRSKLAPFLAEIEGLGPVAGALAAIQFVTRLAAVVGDSRSLTAAIAAGPWVAELIAERAQAVRSKGHRRQLRVIDGDLCAIRTGLLTSARAFLGMATPAEIVAAVKPILHRWAPTGSP